MYSLKWILVCLLAGCSPEYELHSPPLEVPEPPPAYPAEDTWVQQGARVDLDVWVLIDRSCSMGMDDMNVVGAGMAQIVSEIDANSGSWRMYFSTMDPNQLGVDGPHEEAPTIGDLLDLAMVPLGLPRAGAETGFDATKELGAQVERRPDTDLLVVWVSDEDDQSETSPQGIRGWLADQQHPDRTVDVLPVVALDEECGDLGSRYIQVSNTFPSTPASLCSGWEGVLDSFSWVTGLTRSYELTYTPISGTVEVYVNTVLVDNWRLSEHRFVVFDEAPPIYSDIHITYETYDTPE